MYKLALLSQLLTLFCMRGPGGAGDTTSSGFLLLQKETVDLIQ